MPTVEGRVTSPPLVVPGAVFHRSRREVLSTADGRDMATVAVASARGLNAAAAATTRCWLRNGMAGEEWPIDQPSKKNCH
jgi:hypothetical protein